jgi:hypothetical protein
MERIAFTSECGPASETSESNLDIRRHKCPLGFSCTWGDKCRFANIPDAHPDTGEFHKKKNYYDGSKGSKSVSKEQGGGNGWSYGREDEIEEVEFSSW